jgi:hypothetical protein
MTIHANVGGVWKEQTSLTVNVGGVLKNVADVHVNVSGVWKKVFPQDFLPLNLIVFYNGGSIPSGWTRLSVADDKMIIGAGVGTGYRPATTSGQVNMTGTFGTAGIHNHPDSFSDYLANGGQDPIGFKVQHGLDTNFSGDHQHTATLCLNPARNQLKLIKNTVTTNTMLPINTVMPSTQSLSGLTNVYTNDNYLSAGYAITSLPRTPIYELGMGGYHTNRVTQSTSWIDTCSYFNDPGCNLEDWTTWTASNQGHNNLGTSTETITENIRNVLLSCWTNASVMFDLQANMIAMWEGTTAPTGWKLCNGVNGTPDLRNCFIRSGAAGNENIIPTGNNTASAVVTDMNHDWNHTMIGSNYGWDAFRLTKTHSRDVNANHTHAGFTITNQPMIPPYYALSFIIKD